MIDQTTPVPANGIAVTGSTDLLCTDVGGVLSIELTSGDITAEIKHPVVFFQGEPIPYSEYASVATTNGKITLGAGSTAKYSTDEDDFVVYYTDHVLGILVSADVGGVSLPIESNAYKAVGHVEPVIEVSRRGDAEQTGNISVITALTSILFSGSTSPENFAGEELLARIYGSNWTSHGGFNSRNKLNFNTKPFGIAILMHSGKDLAAGDPYHIWGRMRFCYHCELTNISSPQNVTNDTTDPILQNVEFRAKYPIPEMTTILTT
jgi:hypothetical protein